MFYDFTFLWVWLLLILIVGLAAGWLTYTNQPQSPWFHGFVRWAAIAFLVGLVIAWLDLFPRRLGFWLETALFAFAFYVIGCLLGSLLKSLTGRSEFDANPVALSSATMTQTAAKTAPPAAASAPLATAAPADAVPAAAAPTSTASVTPTPAVMGTIEGEDKHDGVRPTGFVTARNDKADDLQRIKGIGPQNEARLHALGIWHFSQIAAWTHENVLWVGSYLAFPGRIDREQWVQQAAILAKGLETEFSQRVEQGLVPHKHDGK